MVGRAGTGKSFSSAFLREVWESQGVKVYGVALSGIAADGLKKEAGLTTHTIAAFLLKAQNYPHFLKKNDVIVMDEAGMCDSPSMLKMLELAKQAQAKLVLIGDPQQVQPVGPGATFRAILEQVGYAELQTVYRQQALWQQQATQAFSQGRIEKAMEPYHAKGCVHVDQHSQSSLEHLVSDWFLLRAKEGGSLKDYAVITHRNQDVARLNHAIRSERILRNEIESGSTSSDNER